MSTRRNGHDGQVRDQLPLSSSLSRYDLVLALIPSLFVLTGVGATLFNVSLAMALAGGAIIGALAVIDALFINPPTRGRPGP